MNAAALPASGPQNDPLHASPARFEKLIASAMKATKIRERPSPFDSTLIGRECAAVEDEAAHISVAREQFVGGYLR